MKVVFKNADKEKLQKELVRMFTIWKGNASEAQLFAKTIRQAKFHAGEMAALARVVEFIESITFED